MLYAYYEEVQRWMNKLFGLYGPPEIGLKSQRGRGAIPLQTLVLCRTLAKILKYTKTLHTAVKTIDVK
jgi:hypothetical protein